MGWFDNLLRDVRYGLRMLRQAPLISIAVVVTLALGIGLDTGVFAVIDGLLLRPRSEAQPETFARLYAQYTQAGSPREFGGLSSVAAYHALEEQSRLLGQLAAWRSDGVVIEDDASRSLAMEVSCNFFEVYGLQQARAGRLFRAEECDRGADAHIVVIAEELWRDRFARDPQILGKTILLNRHPFTVIGVTPVDFSGRLRGPGLWVPYTVQAGLTGKDDIFRLDDTPAVWLEGRLRSGATRSQLASEANLIASRLVTGPRDLKMTVLVTNGSLIEDPNMQSVGFWIMLLVISGITLLLIVSCATVAVLLLSRAAARRREIAVRITLGAARARVLRQLLTENLVLALAAGGMGLYIARQVPRIFRSLIPSMPHYPFSPDWRVFGYLAGVTLAASLLAGLAPALESLRQDIWLTLRGTEAAVHAGKVRWSLRDLLIIMQVSLSVVLMVTCAMFVRVELAILAADPGFDTEQVLQVPVELPAGRYDDPSVRGFYDALMQHLRALPAIQSVATASSSPLGNATEGVSGLPRFRLLAEAPAAGRSASLVAVSSNYFSTIGLQMIRGDAFRNTPSDTSTAVVSQAFAATYWPGQDPIGQIVIGPDEARLRVVGVARDTRAHYPGQPDGPCIYVLRTLPARGDLLLARFRGDAASLQTTVKATVRNLDPQMFALTSTLRGLIDDIAERFWILGKMLLFVALVSAGLALLGIYGVVGYSVTRRTHEFGIRAALGASRRELMRLVLISGLRPVLAGTVLGLLLAAAFAFGLVTILRDAPFTPSARDPLTYTLVCMLLLVSAVAAMLKHAWRAALVEPLVALREE